MKKLPLHIKYGIITSVTLNGLVALLLLFKLQITSTWQMLLTLIVICTGIVASCYAFKKQASAQSGKDIFFHGFRTTTIVALAQIVFGLVVLMLFPHLKNDQIANFNKEAKAFAVSEAKAYKDSSIAKTKDTAAIKIITDSAIKIEQKGIAKATADTNTYKSRFLTSFIGLNMMIVVITGLGASALASLLTKKLI
jgi:hypothetical protein